MKVRLIQVGKTDDPWLREGIMIYEKRLTHYMSYSTQTISSPKNKQEGIPILKKKEALLILNQIQDRDHVILLDEQGVQTGSSGFAELLRELGEGPAAQFVVFIIGGAFGFDDSVYKRAQGLLSLSKMTFSHQMIRLLFTEQLYRGMTILKGQPYHHS